MPCLRCRAPLDRRRDRLVGFSVDVMGDDHVYTYFGCPACGAVSVECWHDRFLGGEEENEVTWLGPFERSLAEEVRHLLRAWCRDPHDRHCSCRAHRPVA